MRDQLETIRREAMEALQEAVHEEALEALRIQYMGKTGTLTALLKQMGGLSAEERPIIGALANQARTAIETALADRKAILHAETQSRRLEAEIVDVTLPGIPRRFGHKHPIAIVLDELTELFAGMGFSVAEGPEVETVYHNFDALNSPENHPARDWQDTFYFADNVLLRTQTSTVQIRVMQEKKPPIRIIAPGRCYRKDEVDATHSPMFHQIEGLVVDRGITMGDLKGTLDAALRGLLGQETRLRFRPHYFPFTEPSAEVDVSCFMCGGKGCSVCKQEGWIELLGAGMVHPRVLEMGGIDPEVYSGFAFGMGLDRLAMLRFAIADMRLLFEGDVRFLRQFV
jgi:phenylalanyl-tRNA synthetase alpha chain